MKPIFKVRYSLWLMAAIYWKFLVKFFHILDLHANHSRQRPKLKILTGHQNRNKSLLTF